jgi:hypothetical protein
MQMAAFLDFLRAIFPYVIAAVFPLAGAIFVVIRLTEGDREDALRIGAATVLGASVYALLLLG